MIRPGLRQVIARGVRKRCPRCGRGRLFRAWYTLDDACRTCGLTYECYEGNTWAFMYLSTAFLTGLILAAMFLIKPDEIWMGRATVVSAAVMAIIASLPRRKAVAVALDYYSEIIWNQPPAQFGDSRNDVNGDNRFVGSPPPHRD